MKLTDFAKKYPIVVETGTFIGLTARQLAMYFKEVHTIELDKGLYLQSLEMLATGAPNVSSYLGDSSFILSSELIDKLNHKDEKVLFFLDAHWSGDDTVDWENSKWKGVQSWARGKNTAHRGNTTKPTAEEQNPLEEEIMNIYNMFNNECIIVIDDWENIGSDGIGFKDKEFIGEDWSNIDMNEIKENIKDRLVEWATIFIDDDVLEQHKTVLLIKLKGRG